MAHILGVGIATLDIIITVDGYPAEDSKVRALAQRVARGGNATNTLAVLSQLGHDCSWAGVLAEEPDAQHILADLAAHGVNTSAVHIVPTGKVPTSYIVHNARNASRTVVHHRDLPEYGAEDFTRLELHAYDWVHFEGRAVQDTLQMLMQARRARPDLTRSVELEAVRPGIAALAPHAEVVFFSKSYARACGHAAAGDFLRDMRGLAPRGLLVCAWGEGGAYALDARNELVHAPAVAPREIVDTIGAGDTFNGAFIDAMLRKLPLPGALAFACRVAGAKCGTVGLSLPEHAAHA